MTKVGSARHIFISACLLAAIAATASGYTSAGWWNISWPHRRVITTQKLPPTSLPGQDIAVVDMPTAGKIDLGEPSLRVVTARGRVMPHRAVMTGPGDTIRIAFALQPTTTQYYVYFGRPEETKAQPLEIRRGLLLEMWRRPRGPINTFGQIEKMFAKTDKSLGRSFRQRVFLGHNPFGRDNASASKFTGWLICPSDGEYTFCTSSADASFLLIDDKLVVDNGGRHAPQRTPSVRASVELAAGLHKLTMYYVSGRKRYTAVAAWQPPGRKRIWPIGAKAFAPVARAAAGPMENYGQVVTIDFLPAHSGETFVAGRYYQRYTFEARVVGRGGRNISWHWDFGDRQSSDLPEAQHVYLRPGDYTVKLTARTYAGLLERTNKIHVSRPWDRVVVKKIDKVVRHGQIVAGYDFDRMRPAEIMHAVRILGRTEFSDAVLAAGDALLKRRKAGAHAVDWTMTEYTKVLLARRDVDQAVEALKKAETISATPHIAAKMLIRAGQILLKEKSDDRAALELFDLAISRYGPQVPAETVRDAHIGIADVWRLRGDYDRAMAAYPAAKPLRYRDPAKAAFRRGDFARHVIDYLRREEHKAAADQLDKWEHTFPADKLAGYTTLLRVLLLAATDMHSQAATRARALVKVNPSSNYAPRLLMLAAESYAAMGRTEDATAALKLVVSGYPESALAAEAAKKL